MTNEPVGLLGDTIRIARVRGVTAASRESKSIRQPRVRVEIVGARRHLLEARQVVEQRIARPRDQHLVAGIGKQLEQAAVRLARAGRQRDPFRCDTSRPRRA